MEVMVNRLKVNDDYKEMYDKGDCENYYRK